MREVQGGPFGIDQNAQAITIDTIGNNNYIKVATGPWLHIFNKAAIVEGDIERDPLGLYSKLVVNGEGKAKFGHFRMPNHLFRPRQNGCVWAPNGKIRMGLTEFDTCPIEYQGEQCPDAYWDSCFEGLFGEGRQVRDLYSSPDLRDLMMKTLEALAVGLGNSFHSLYHFAKHPAITTADTAGKSVTDGDGGYLVDDDEWEAYYAQQVGTDDRLVNCAGMVTLLDQLADEGERGYDIDIPSSDIDADNNYTGDIIALFNKLIDRAKPMLRTIARKGQGTGTAKRYPILLVTEPEFRAYEEYLSTNFSQQPGILNYTLTGTNGPLMVPGVLNWKGIPVVAWDESTAFDEIVGTKSHRVALVAPGSFGIASDVRSLRQNAGMGLRVVQKLDPPDNGKIYMDTTLRWGAAIPDTEFIVYARNLNPA